jgi:hypothetical protein
VAIFPIFGFECIWLVVLGVKISKFQERETFIAPKFIEMPSVLLCSEIYLTELKFELSFVQFIWKTPTFSSLESDL